MPTLIENKIRTADSIDTPPDSAINRKIMGDAVEQVVILSQKIRYSYVTRDVERRTGGDTDAYVLGIRKDIETTDHLDGYAPWAVNALMEAIEGANDKDLPDTLGSVWSVMETLYASGAMSTKAGDQIADRTTMALIDKARSYITSDPQGGDLLVAHSSGSRNMFRLFIAAESAYARDFDEAAKAIEDIEQSQYSKEHFLAKLSEAAKMDSRPNMISDEASAANLERLIRHQETPISKEQVEAANPMVTVGTTLETLQEMLGPGGRYLTVHEHNTASGGANRLGKGYRDASYNDSRARTERMMGRSDNPFAPRPVYGALTSDLQMDRASGYGLVTLYPAESLINNPATTYTYGDSLNTHLRPAHEAVLNSEDSKVAYRYIMGQWHNTSDSKDLYVEAHLPGLNINDIEKVGLHRLAQQDSALLYAAAGELLERGVLVEITYEWGAHTTDYIQYYCEAIGKTEQEAYKQIAKDIKGDYADNPLLTVVVLVPSVEGVQMSVNTDLLRQNGIEVRKPIIKTRADHRIKE